MRVSPALLLACLGVASAACTSGDFRRVSLTQDLGPGDLAHFESVARDWRSTPAEIEDFSLGVPFFPVLCGSHETTADRASDGNFYYHVEDVDGLLLYLLASSATTANFGPDGHNMDWSDSHSLLLGAVGTSRGERDTAGGRTRQTGFKLLWGLLFRTASDGDATRWSLLMFPFGGG